MCEALQAAQPCAHSLFGQQCSCLWLAGHLPAGSGQDAAVRATRPEYSAAVHSSVQVAAAGSACVPAADCAAIRAPCNACRSITRGSLQALAYCHEQVGRRRVGVQGAPLGISLHALPTCYHPCYAYDRVPCFCTLPERVVFSARLQGVVHGALGSGSVMLSTFDDRSAARLVVKLDNVS